MNDAIDERMNDDRMIEWIIGHIDDGVHRSFDHRFIIE